MRSSPMPQIRRTAHRSDVGELPPEGRDIADFEELVVIVDGACGAAGDGTGVGLGVLLELEGGCWRRHGDGQEEGGGQAAVDDNGAPDD